LGRAAPADAGADPELYDEVSRQVDVLVVGGGAAGMAAALAASRGGHEVLLAEGAAGLGGWAASTRGAAADEAQALAAQLSASPVTVLSRCTIIGLYDDRLAVGVEQVGGKVRERLWKIRARRIVLATGAFERPMLFPDNDRPGVMLASAVQRYAALYGVACGRRVVLATACDSAYGVAQELLAAGVQVAAIVDHRPQAGAAAPPGVEVLPGHALVAVQGRHGVQSITVASHDGTARRTIEADCVACAGGWTPAVHLHSMAGGRLRWDDTASMFLPAQAPEGIDSVGACAGVFDFTAALGEIERLAGERERLADQLTAEAWSAAAEITRLTRERDEAVLDAIERRLAAGESPPA
jgi:sarcosine oxidase subunit alpha